MKHVPNIITSSRFVFAILIAFSEPLTVTFWVLYGIACTTDLIDGPIARKLKVNNAGIGAALDSAADICLLICMMISVFPTLDIYFHSYVIIGGVLFLKVVSIVFAYIKYKKIVSYHTYSIKFMALFLFTFPFWIMFFDINNIILVLASLQALVYIEELVITGKSKESDPNTKSIYHVLKRN